MVKKSKITEIDKTENVSGYPADGLRYLIKTEKYLFNRFCDTDNMNDSTKEEWTKDLVLCCMDDIFDILKCTNWRPWKIPEKISMQKKVELKYDIIHLLKFVLNLSIVWGMDEKEIIGIYKNKKSEEIKRQKISNIFKSK
jgi:hypothetical protein